MSFRISACKKYHECQNSLNKDFACRSKAHRGQGWFLGQGGSCLSPRTKGSHRVLCLVFLLQWWFQSCLVEPAEAWLKKFVYMLRRHISLGWLLGICTATQKNLRSSSAALAMSAILKVEFQGRTISHSPAQKAGLCRFSISLLTVLPVFATLRVHLAGLPRCLGMWVCASVLQLSPGLCRLGCAQSGCTTAGFHWHPWTIDTIEKQRREDLKNPLIASWGTHHNTIRENSAEWNPCSDKPWPWKASDAKFRMELLWLGAQHPSLLALTAVTHLCCCASLLLEKEHQAKWSCKPLTPNHRLSL